MVKIISIAMLHLATLASFLSLYFTLVPPSDGRPSWHWPLLTMAVIVVLVLIVNEIVQHLRTSPKLFSKKENINAYLRRWVTSGGRAVILSRDMSWAGEADTENALFEKARAGDLTICLEKNTALTNKLKKVGAQIVTYGKYGQAPLSRFTIIDFGRDGARVAVGVPVGNKHVIQEFQSGRHPYFAVAEDLVNFLVAASKIKHDVQKT